MKHEYYYHVVTEKPMIIGQHIILDENHPNGVYKRVMKKERTINELYKHPDKYRNRHLQHHTKVALRELAMEQIRKRYFPNYPSRMACLYVSSNLEDSIKWSELFVNFGRPTYSIVKLQINGKVFVGDANNCFYGTINNNENLVLAKNYWENKPNKLKVNPIYETLVSGDIKVVEIVKEINKNI